MGGNRRGEGEGGGGKKGWEAGVPKVEGTSGRI